MLKLNDKDQEEPEEPFEMREGYVGKLEQCYVSFMEEVRGGLRWKWGLVG